ncbi:MAG TPA: homoserine O-succinyltransferase [Rhodanobacteraceae bacterium]|jgi:homoserine O-acetyltransferase|nr:homoserine O-succinyltransferase [Rhodanobacteraceae bacterium]
MSLAVAPEVAEPRIAEPHVADAFAVLPAIPFACQRVTRRVQIAPHYGEGPVEVEVRYLWTGAPGAPTVIVQGGISADRDVCANPEHAAPGWWEALVGRGRAIDLDRVRVLAIDWLDADDLAAPSVSSEDQADVLAALLDTLGIARVEAFVGASYGAMVGLAFAARHGDRVGKLVALAGAHRPHPYATAQRAVQRGIVKLGLDNGCVDEALSLARQLALTTYRSGEEIGRRFAGGAEYRDGRFQLPVEGWLEHQGRKFVARFDAHRYLALSESIDLHDIDPKSVRVPATLIGFASDKLVPLADLCALQQRLGAPASLEVIETPYGHDGFLKEHERLAPLLREALNEWSVT